MGLPNRRAGRPVVPHGGAVRMPGADSVSRVRDIVRSSNSAV